MSATLSIEHNTTQNDSINYTLHCGTHMYMYVDMYTQIAVIAYPLNARECERVRECV